MNNLSKLQMLIGNSKKGALEIISELSKLRNLTGIKCEHVK